VIIYAETNFLLELAYRQERCESCEEILAMARAGTITFALPALCVAEARATLKRRTDERREFHDNLKKHLREISRSQSFRGLMEDSRDVVAAFITDAEESKVRLEEAVHAIRSSGVLIPLNGEIVWESRLYEIVLSLSSEDALILESVRSHAAGEKGPKCFVTQDARRFAHRIPEELARVQCKVLTNFTDAVAYIRNALKLPS